MDWRDAGSKKAEAKKYKNCIHPPLIETSVDKSFLEIIPPPELHLMLGVVNTLFSHLISGFEQEALKWAELCNVQREITHGSPAFKGNSCKILLNKVDLLRTNCSLGCLKFVEAFQSLNKIVKACFSVNLDPDFTKYIAEFKESYLALNVSVTPKVHAVFFHVEDFCMKMKIGLGLYSEQPMESVHFDFSVTWEKYKVARNNPDYETKLLRAVCEYNSNHM